VLVTVLPPAPCTPPGTPLGLIFGVTGSFVSLAWSPPSGGAAPADYIVQAGHNSGGIEIYNGSVGLATSVGAPVPGGLYYVRVRARNACGVSPSSNQVVITVP
jgi:hypothetical protein